MNVVVSGYYVGFPLVGLFWHVVSFALGFAELGHDVWYLEDSGDQPWGFDFERLDFDHDCRYGVRRLTAEEGLLPFDGPAAAAEAIRTVEEEPERHAKAARAIAERIAGARVVGGLLRAAEVDR